MSVEAEITLRDALFAAVTARAAAEVAREEERRRVWTYIHEARRQHLSWRQIGEKLEISDNAVKSYYERNRGRVIDV